MQPWLVRRQRWTGIGIDRRLVPPPRVPAYCMSPSKKSLTRRANHRHISIIAEIAKARAGKLAAGFFIGDR